MADNLLIFGGFIFAIASLYYIGKETIKENRRQQRADEAKRRLAEQNGDSERTS